MNTVNSLQPNCNVVQVIHITTNHSVCSFTADFSLHLGHHYCLFSHCFSS